MAARRAFPEDHGAARALEFKIRNSRFRMPRLRQFIETYLKIKDKGGRIIPFILNQSQRYSLAQILKESRKREAWVYSVDGKIRFQRERAATSEAGLKVYWRDFETQETFDQVPKETWADRTLERAPGPIQIIILKARQQGISTLMQGLFFESILRSDNVAVKLMSHAGESAAEILEMPGRFIDNLMLDGEKVELPMKSRNESEGLIHFDKPFGGKITIGTAQAKKDPGRGATYQKGHFTEIGDWEPKAYEIMTALLQVVHRVPGTVVACESTAKGAKGWFYDTWNRAERGESDFVPIFLPWFWDEACRKLDATPTDLQEIQATLDDPKYCDSGKEETWLLEQEFYRPGHGHVFVDLVQLAWRRWAIYNKSSGSIEKFHQEYPAYPQEAFLASGRPVFDQRVMHDRMQQPFADPIFVGDLSPMDWKVFLTEENPFDWFEKHPDPELVENRYGKLRIWEKPDPDLSYGVSMDCSEGVEGGDFTVIDVGEFYSGRQVAEWHGLLNPIDAARVAARLGYWYNTALIGPEKNFHGFTAINELVDSVLYPNLFQRKVRAKVNALPTEHFGWLTTVPSRKQLFNTFRIFFRDYPELFHNQKLLQEMRQISYNDRDLEVAPKVGEDGEPGHDDRVMAKGIFLQMRDEAFRLNIVKTPEKKVLGPNHEEWARVTRLLEQANPDYEEEPEDDY